MKTRLPRYHKGRVEEQLLSPQCYQCGGTLYHDFDPAHYHNGATCLACGREQPLRNGSTSLLHPKHERVSVAILREPKYAN